MIGKELICVHLAMARRSACINISTYKDLHQLEYPFACGDHRKLDDDDNEIGNCAYS